MLALHEQPKPMVQTLARCVAVATILLGSAGCGTISSQNNRQGVALLNQGNPQEAMSRFQKALANDPRNADALYNLAAVMHRQGIQTKNQDYLTQAETLYNQCLDVARDHPECHRGLAVLLAETDRSDKAFTLLRNWATTSPQSAPARLELARLYEEFGDTKSAATNLQDALQLDSRNEKAWAALAILREREGDYQQALSNYQRAYSLNMNPELAQRIAALNNRLASNTSAPVGGGASDTIGGMDPKVPNGWRTRLSSPGVSTPRY